MNYNSNKYINMGWISQKKRIASRVPSQSIQLIEQGKLIEIIKNDERRGIDKSKV